MLVHIGDKVIDSSKEGVAIFFDDASELHFLGFLCVYVCVSISVVSF